MKMLASQYIETVWRKFLHVSWTVYNKFQFDVTYILLEWSQKNFFTPPTAFWKWVFEGMCIWDTVMAKLGTGVINNDSWFMGIKNRKIWAKFYRI